MEFHKGISWGGQQKWGLSERPSLSRRYSSQAGPISGPYSRFLLPLIMGYFPSLPPYHSCYECGSRASFNHAEFALMVAKNSVVLPHHDPPRRKLESCLQDHFSDFFSEEARPVALRFPCARCVAPRLCTRRRQLFRTAAMLPVSQSSLEAPRASGMPSSNDSATKA